MVCTVLRLGGKWYMTVLLCLMMCLLHNMLHTQLCWECRTFTHSVSRCRAMVFQTILPHSSRNDSRCRPERNRGRKNAMKPLLDACLCYFWSQLLWAPVLLDTCLLYFNRWSLCAPLRLFSASTDIVIAAVPDTLSKSTVAHHP